MNGIREKIFCNLLRKSKSKNGEKFWSIFFNFYCHFILGFEFSPQTQVGENLSIVHGARGSVVNPSSIIGNNCIIRNNTIIGNNGLGGGSPFIGNNVNIGSNSCIIGHVTIGDNVIIGAGSIVVKDVPANAVVVGNPAKVIKFIDTTSEESNYEVTKENDICDSGNT